MQRRSARSGPELTVDTFFLEGDETWSRRHPHSLRSLIQGVTKRYGLCSLCLLACACGFCLLLTFSPDETASSRQVKQMQKLLRPVSSPMQRQVEEKECTIWIAPSSLKGVNGYGIFTTRPLAVGESLLGAPDGLAVPVEMYEHRSKPPVRERTQFLNLWGEYMWGRGLPDHAAYESPTGVLDFQIGFGALPNHHCLLSFLDMVYPDPPYDDSLADRFHDPSAGAFTYNRGREFVVQQAAEAGDEIFLNYGYCERTAQSPPWTRGIYMTDDFIQAASLIKQGILFDDNGKLVVPQGTSDLVVSLLPQTSDDLHNFYDNKTNFSSLLVRQIARNSLNTRSPGWIREHGVCMDNLIAKPSTLPIAGQGAFAQRTIRKGDLVTPAPLMPIVNKESLEIYNKQGERNGTQLLLNYCFGHSQSTLLVCPNTNAQLINHCSIRSKECGTLGPNAEYRWSSGQQMTIDEISALTSARGLAFEIVATRDIYPGEEVFMDYGVEWENAWAEHVKHYQPPPKPLESTTPWISARHANENKGPILEALVSGDLRKTVSHPYLFTGCVYWETEWDSHPIFRPPSGTDVDWTRMPDKELLETFSDPGTHYVYRDRHNYLHHQDNLHWPCTVLQQHEGDGSYIVRIHPPPWRKSNARGQPPLFWHDNELPRLLRNYPRDSIHYFVHPSSSDQHLPGVFRHEIRIRDELFPEQWKNL